MSETEARKYVVYQLRASDEDTPFYIGKTYLGSGRKNQHIRGRRQDSKTYKHAKCTSIKNRGANVLFEIVSTFEYEEDALREEAWLISVLGKKVDGGGLLTNILDGGRGSSGLIHRKESRDKMSVSKRLNAFSKEEGDSISVFDIHGKFMKVFIHARAAADYFGFSKDSIYKAIRGKTSCVVKNHQVFKGVWIDDVPSKIGFSVRTNPVIILQYSLSGELIGRYSNIKYAAYKNDIPKGRISAALHDGPSLPKSYFWKREFLVGVDSSLVEW